MPNRKVYCKNCKYCKYREFAALGVNWGWFCRLEEIYTIDTVGNAGVDFSKSNCEDLNKDFNCLDYKRKWYKWWVK